MRRKATSNLSHSKKKSTPGPKADRLKLNGNWKDLVKKSPVQEEASGRLAEVESMSSMKNYARGVLGGILALLAAFRSLLILRC